jgi:hypothetical protein
MMGPAFMPRLGPRNAAMNRPARNSSLSSMGSTFHVRATGKFRRACPNCSCICRRDASNGVPPARTASSAAASCGTGLGEPCTLKARASLNFSRTPLFPDPFGPVKMRWRGRSELELTVRSTSSWSTLRQLSTQTRVMYAIPSEGYHVEYPRHHAPPLTLRQWPHTAEVPWWASDADSTASHWLSGASHWLWVLAAIRPSRPSSCRRPRPSSGGRGCW